MFDTHGLHSQTNCQSTCFVHRNYLIEHEARGSTCVCVVNKRRSMKFLRD